MVAGWRRPLNNSSDAPSFLLGSARRVRPLRASSFLARHHPPSMTDITADRGHFGCLTAAFWVMEDAAIGRCDAGPDVQAGAVGRPTKAVQEQTRERLGFPG